VSVPPGSRRYGRPCYAFDEPAAHSAMGEEKHPRKPEAARRKLIEQYLSVWHS